ncbi:DUF4278 domain-containing protein [Pleurocapsales cyanobacterium LEGE 06147]|nr:DUF4278 domain-containing protein [Pleurocapsales cyanobacterium LEGE 06147]
MKLTYRGVSYDYNPPTVAVNEGTVAGKFRGLDWRFHNLKKPPVLQPPVNLTYRGVAYANRPVNTGIDVREKARWLMLNKEKAVKNRAASMLSRAAHEVGLV